MGDRRCLHALQAADHPVEPRLVRERVVRGPQVLELADVGAGHEGPVAGAAQDEDPHGGVGVGRIAGLEEGVVHRPRHRIAGGGAVEGEGGDGAVDGVEGFGRGHGSILRVSRQECGGTARTPAGRAGRRAVPPGGG